MCPFDIHEIIDGPPQDLVNSLSDEKFDRLTDILSKSDSVEIWETTKRIIRDHDIQDGRV